MSQESDIQTKLDSVANDLTTKASKDEIDNLRKELETYKQEVESLKKLFSTDLVGDIKNRLQRLEVLQNRQPQNRNTTDQYTTLSQALQKIENKVNELSQQSIVSELKSATQSALDSIGSTLSKHNQQLNVHDQLLSSINSNTRSQTTQTEKFKFNVPTYEKRTVGSQETDVSSLVPLQEKVSIPPVIHNEPVSQQLMASLTNTPSIFASNMRTPSSLFDTKSQNMYSGKKTQESLSDLMARTMQKSQEMQQRYQQQKLESYKIEDKKYQQQKLENYRADDQNSQHRSPQQKLENYKPDDQSSQHRSPQQKPEPYKFDDQTLQKLQEYVKVNGTQGLHPAISNIVQNNMPQQTSTDQSYMALQQQIAKKTANVTAPPTFPSVSSLQHSNVTTLSMKGGVRSMPLSTPFRTT